MVTTNEKGASTVALYGNVSFWREIDISKFGDIRAEQGFQSSFVKIRFPGLTPVMAHSSSPFLSRMHLVTLRCISGRNLYCEIGPL